MSMKPTLNANESSLYPLLEEFNRWSRLNQYGLDFIERHRALVVDENDSSVTVAIPPD